MNDKWTLLWQIALRNLRAHRRKSLIVGFILFLATGIIVFFGALVDAVDAGMTRSVTQSAAGHLQIHSADAKDKLAIYGDEFASMPDIGLMPDFAAVAKVVRAVPNVKAIVPMGIDFAMSSQGNEMDRWLASLRQAVRDGDEPKIVERRDHVRTVVKRMYDELSGAKEMISAGGDFVKQLADAKRATEPEFWNTFDADRLAALEFLENKISPLETHLSDAWVQFLGTDLDAFEANFDRFKLVEGTRVPKGKRGFLFNHGFYEEYLKHRVARVLDALKRHRDEGHSIDDDAEARGKRDRLVGQYRRVLYQLDLAAGVKLEAELRTYLAQNEADLPTLLQDLLKVNDSNFDERYAWFYEHIAPHIELYPVKIGDVIPLQAFTRSGYSKSVNVKVYGTYTFEGLEKSDLGKAFNLLDLITFRELYALMTPERMAEVQALLEKSGIKDVKREGAEAELFGGGDTELEKTVVARGFDEFGEGGIGKISRSDAEEGFDPAELERGVAINAAVLLHDGSTEAQATALLAIEAATKAADLNVKVVGWQEAAGMVGQLAVVARLILYVIVFLLLLVAVVVINNSMVIATMERVKEIGTRRAIGASRRYIASLFVIETFVLGLVAGGLGVVGGVTGIVFWQAVGLPAQNAFMTFLFSGPRLHPDVSLTHILVALTLTMFFALLSTLYPAWLASRIRPVTAMAEDG